MEFEVLHSRITNITVENDGKLFTVDLMLAFNNGKGQNITAILDVSKGTIREKLMGFVKNKSKK